MTDRPIKESEDAGNGSRGPNASTAAAANGPIELGPEQFERWARLVADGEAEIPHELPVEQLDQLVAEVRLRRRVRLVRFMARAIARQLHSRGSPSKEFSDDCRAV